MAFMQKIVKGKLWLPLIVIALVLANWLASLFHKRIDFTNEKRFTLSSATKKIIRQLPGTVTIDVFLKGSSNSGFTRLGKASEELLQEFKEAGGSKIQYRFISPEAEMEGTGVTYADTLYSMGVVPINLTSQVKQGQQQQLVYPTALVHYGEQVIPVNLYSGDPLITYSAINSAEAQLEYKFAAAIDKLTNANKPMLAYSRGNGEPQGGNVLDLVENVLRPDYNLFMFDLERGPIPDTFKLLLIVKPTKPFSETAKMYIDQFVMHGGKLLVFVDKLEAELDSLRIKNEVIAYDRGLQLNDLLFKYGVRINSDLVMDLQCDFLPFDVSGNGQFEQLPWNYFPRFVSKSNHPINKNMGHVSGRFVNSIDTVEADGISKTILLSSSANARSISTPALISGRQNATAPDDATFNKADIPVAVLLEGKFQSLYKNRVSRDMLDSLAKYNTGFMQQCISDNKIIIVSDGDMVLNSFVGQEPIGMGMNPFTYGTQKQFQVANRDFLQNCLNYLINQNGLAEAKAKDYSQRLLDSKKVTAQKTKWQVVNIIVPVILVILLALGYQWWRRKKYAN
jgi:ABC-2 type transport system permease protein